MSHVVNLGIVGCGYWGPNLIRNFRQSTQGVVKTMCDVSVKRLDHLHSLYPEIGATTNFEELLRDPGINAVVIATPASTHYRMAKQVLASGKHVFIEKPMALCSKDCEELMEMSRQLGRVLMVGHTYLFSPAVRKIKEIVERGELGELRYISARRLNLGLFQKDLNVAWDLAPHDISIILQLLEELPIAVNACGEAHTTPGVEDVTSICLTFRNHRSALIHSSWLDSRKVREMTIVGSQKMIVYDDVAPLEKIRIYDTRVERPPHYDTFGEFQYSYHYGDMLVPYLKQDEPLKLEAQHFLDCIIQGRTPLTDGKSGLELVRILEAASTSIRRHGAAVEFVEPPGNVIVCPSLDPEPHQSAVAHA